jgi:hypothetical protein
MPTQYTSSRRIGDQANHTEFEIVPHAALERFDRSLLG